MTKILFFVMGWCIFCSSG